MPKIVRVLLAIACFVIVTAGMKAAAPILVPFLLSVFISVICAPGLFWMQRKGVPNGLAVLSVLLGIVVISSFLAVVVGKSLNNFISTLPLYQAQLTEKTSNLISWLNGHGIEVSGSILVEQLNPGRVMKMAAGTLTGLSSALTNLFMILLTVIFILMEASGFPQKIRAALKTPDKSLPRFGAISESINRYLAIKTFFSLITGTAICIWLAILGLDYPLLWGLTAFLLNYVPNIGSIIAAVPAVLLAMVQLGPGNSLLVCLGYVAVNVVFGSILEPRFMGRGLGLSALVVFLSLVFWGWILGPVGMLLSVPLTMIVKIGLESDKESHWIAVLLGSAPEVKAELKATEKNGR